MIRLDELVRKMMIDKQFYGYTLQRFNKCVISSKDKTSIAGKAITTAAIDLINLMLYVNEEFMEPLDDRQRMVILEHEVLHSAFNHFFRFSELWKKDDPLVNIACDCAINQLIDIASLPTDYQKNLISIELLEKQFGLKLELKRPSEYYYEVLNKRRDEIEEMIKNSPEFKELLDKIKNGHKFSSQGINPSNENTVFNKINNILKEAKEISEAHDRRCGNTSGDSITSILPDYNQRVDKRVWLRAMSRVVGWTPVADTYFVYNKPNRFNKLSNWGKRHDLINNKVYVILDSSGSISDEHLKCFMGQIWKAVSMGEIEVELIVCDYEIKEVVNLNKVAKNRKFDVKGRSGTDMIKALDYIEKKPERFKRVIMLTDGETGWRRPAPGIDMTAIYTRQHHDLEGVRYSAVLEI